MKKSFKALAIFLSVVLSGISLINPVFAGEIKSQYNTDEILSNEFSGECTLSLDNKFNYNNIYSINNNFYYHKNHFRHDVQSINCTNCVYQSLSSQKKHMRAHKSMREHNNIREHNNMREHKNIREHSNMREHSNIREHSNMRE